MFLRTSADILHLSLFLACKNALFYAYHVYLDVILSD